MRHRFRRHGQSTLAALIVLPLMLGTLFLVLYLIRSRDSLTELRNTSVAAALAAAEGLVDDDLLVDDPARIRPLLDRGRQNAKAVCHQNLVEGKRVVLTVGEADGSKGDVDLAFGHMDQAIGGRFLPLDARSAKPADWGQLNSAEVTVRQPGKPSVSIRVSAVLDRAVIGFRPFDDKTTPLMPVALYNGGSDELPRWDELVASSPDAARRRRGGGGFESGADGLPEVVVRVGRRPAADAEACGLPLVFDPTAPEKVIEQIATGLSRPALAAFGGELVLGPANTVAVPAEPDLLRSRPERAGVGEKLQNVPSAGDPAQHELGEREARVPTAAEKSRDDTQPADPVLAAFRQLAESGDARVWPLFEACDDDGRAVVIGFTAARVVSVERDAPNGALVLRLQPAVLAQPSAVTDPGRQTRDGKPVGNRNVVKIRLAG